MSTKRQCKRALDLHDERLSRCGNVVGLGVVSREASQGREAAVAVYVRKKLPLSQLAADDVVPSVLEIPGRGHVVEVPTRVIEQGEASLEDPATEPV